MSDYDDDVDMDSTAQTAMKFSSDNTNAKGKKIVADLPVGAEDNLPWYADLLILSEECLLTDCRVEKYRPSSLDEVQGHQDILATINRFIDSHVCQTIFNLV